MPPEPSLTSNPGTEEAVPLETDFLLLGKGAAASVREPRPGGKPLRSGFTFSFSAADGGAERTGLTELSLGQSQKKRDAKTKSVMKASL